MTTEQIKVELQNKIKEYEMQSKLVSQEVINWLNDLIKKIDDHIVEANEKVKKEIKVEIDTSLMKEDTIKEIEEVEKKPIRSRWKSKWK